MSPAWIVSIILVLCALTSPTQAREQLGQLKVDNLVIRPQFRLLEPAKANFELGESLFSVRWDMDTKIGAVFTVGAKDLIGTSTHFAPELNQDLGFIEAYGEYNFDYGTIRAGLQPVGFGIEGSVGEADLDMPRSLLYQERIVPLRDIGVSYAIDHNGYFTRLMIHNGESGANLDGRPWYTAKWGWTKSGRWRLGMAGQTGTTKPTSTSTSQDNLAGVDITKEAQWRLGGPFMVWTPHRWRLAFEGYLGELSQEKDLRKYSAGYWSLSYSGQAWFFGLRYDQIDPNHDLDNDLKRQVTLTLGLLSERRTSRVFLVATKVFEESNQIPNDELRLVWHLTPLLPSAVPEL
ncbi:MAG: hypothetical protein AB7N80_14555 [Bdellovibrionales bacterium]